MKRHLLYWLPLALYYALITYLSGQQNLPSPLGFENSDKLIHTLEYLPVGFFLYMAWRKTLTHRRWAAPVAFITAALLGAVDEYHQSFVPTRQSSVWDWVADITGIALGIGLYASWLRLRTRRIP